MSVKKSWNPAYDASSVIGTGVDESKLTKSKITDYIGNKIYEDGLLKSVLVEGGYYDVEAKKYCFYLKDHQGNNRVVIDQSGTILQKTHYYPFGGSFAESTGEDKQPYKYNGKEQESDFGLTLYDYHARWYDPVVGQFTTPDPLAEKYYSTSPYAYCLGNPVNRIDPTGMESVESSDEDERKKNDKDNFLSSLSIQKQFLKAIGFNNLTPAGSDAKTKNEFLKKREDGRQKTQDNLDIAATVVNELADVAETIVPYGSLIRFGTDIGLGDFGGAFAVAPFALLDGASFGNGKVVKAAAKGAKNFFDGAKYSKKVLRQMNKTDDIFHAFPKSVDGYANKFGKYSTKMGLDGKTYEWLEIKGSYKGKTGTFEYIKKPDGEINHRFFRMEQ